jgi:RNA polymerase sigma factor (sigma-70 family)
MEVLLGECEKRPAGLTLKAVCELRERARKYAKRKFPTTNDAEDFAQYAVMHLIQGRKASFSQLLTDFLRQTYGDSRTGANTVVMEYKDSETPDWRRDFRIALDIKKDVKQLMANCLDGRDVSIIKLKYFYDLNDVEIADVFGITPSRVSGILSRVLAKLRAAEKSPTQSPPLVVPKPVEKKSSRRGKHYEAEREVFLESLRRNGGNRTHTAKDLGLSLRTVRNKLKYYGVEYAASI